MRNRTREFAALLALTCLLAMGCQDPTDPPTHDVVQPPAYMLAPQSIGPVTVSHIHGRKREISFVVHDNQPGLVITQPAPSNIASVPLFDPSLGKLLSARLVIDGWLASSLKVHSLGPIYMSSDYSASFGAHATMDPLLTTLTGTDAIHLNSRHRGFVEDYGEFSDGATAGFDVNSHEEDTYAFDETYAGPEVDSFVQTGEPGADGTLDLTWGTQQWFTTSALHDGQGITSFFDLKRSDPLKELILASENATLVFIAASLAFELTDHSLFYNDMHGGASAQFRMQVIYTYQPNRPPVCRTARPSVAELWPPNGRMVSVGIQGVTDPDDDPLTLVVSSIHQDEPTNGAGDGNRAPDGTGVGTSTPQVRAERSGSGNGRVYYVGFDASDGRGGTCSGTVRVNVPHSRARNGAAAADGANYDSTR